MPLIYAKSKPDAVVPRAPGEKPISRTAFEPVLDTPWIRRRIADGDLEVKADDTPKAAPKADDTPKAAPSAPAAPKATPSAPAAPKATPSA